MGMIYLSNVVIVQQYFDRRRGTATGLAMAGLSFGTMTHAILIQWLLSQVELHDVITVQRCTTLSVCAFQRLFLKTSF